MVFDHILFFPTLFSWVMRKKAKSTLKVNYHWLIVFCHFYRWLDRTSHFPKPNLLWRFRVWLFPKVSQKFQINPVGLIPNDQVTKSGRNRSPLECPWAGIGIFISWMWSSSSWIWGIYTETGNFLVPNSLHIFCIFNFILILFIFGIFTIRVSGSKLEVPLRFHGHTTLNTYHTPSRSDWTTQSHMELRFIYPILPVIQPVIHLVMN